MVLVRDRTDRRHAGAADEPLLAGIEPQDRIALVAAGDLAAFPTAGHLAAAAGLVPVPNASGRRAGTLHKPCATAGLFDMRSISRPRPR